MLKPDRSVYTPTDFLQWRESNTLEITPKFQRRGVWKAAARSYFVDTLLRSMPVPPIYLRVVQSEDHKRVVREVVDGQQRVSAVMDFIDSKYRLSKALDTTWAGKTFEDLTAEEQQRITTFSFSAEVFHGISDLEVLEIFARLNTYSVPLNAQELRNGKYFGHFKQCAYGLGHEHLEFWRQHRVFTERNIARMLEVEFVSEAMVAQIDGMQDKKKSIDNFYALNDEQFPNRQQIERRFRDAADTITESMSDQLREAEFRRPPLLYTLFCVVHHRMFGLPKETRPTLKRALTKSERLALRDAVSSLSEHVVAARNREPVPKVYAGFVAACLTQTDNIKPRRERFSVLYRKAFL